jgi:hypothetical protein
MRGRRQGRRAAVALALAGVLAGAGSVAAAADEEPIYLPIVDLLPGITDRSEQDAGIPCPSGSPRCVDRTLRRLRKMVRSDGCDHKGVFTGNYLIVTRAYARVARTRNGRRHSDHFDDPAWLAREDALFAKQYFVARRHWRSSRTRDRVAPAWRIAFTAADEGSTTGFGDLLLGINAHVANDMPFMIAATGLHMSDGRSRKPDHDRFNRTLSDSFDDVLEDVAARFDPTANPDVPGTELDKTVIYQILALLREGVWRNAERLEQASTDAERNRIKGQIESNAAGNARMIRAMFPSPDGSAARDAYCRAQLRARRAVG